MAADQAPGRPRRPGAGGTGARGLGAHRRHDHGPAGRALGGASGRERAGAGAGPGTPRSLPDDGETDAGPAGGRALLPSGVAVRAEAGRLPDRGLRAAGGRDPAQSQRQGPDVAASGGGPGAGGAGRGGDGPGRRGGCPERGGSAGLRHAAGGAGPGPPPGVGRAIGAAGLLPVRPALPGRSLASADAADAAQGPAGPGAGAGGRRAAGGVRGGQRRGVLRGGGGTGAGGNAGQTQGQQLRARGPERGLAQGEGRAVAGLRGRGLYARRGSAGQHAGGHPRGPVRRGEAAVRRARGQRLRPGGVGRSAGADGAAAQRSLSLRNDAGPAGLGGPVGAANAGGANQILAVDQGRAAACAGVRGPSNGTRRLAP